jgi:hypothetical protein
MQGTFSLGGCAERESVRESERESVCVGVGGVVWSCLGGSVSVSDVEVGGWWASVCVQGTFAAVS